MLKVSAIFLFCVLCCDFAQANLTSQVRTRVRILKTTLVQNSSGSYYQDVAEVCAVEGVADLYDLRSTVGGATFSNRVADCDSEIGGVAMNVYVNLNVALLRGKIFADEPESDYRLALLTLSSNEKLSGLPRTHLIGRGLARDISAANIVYGEEAETFTCDRMGTCQPSQKATFSVVVEVRP